MLRLQWISIEIAFKNEEELQRLLVSIG